MGFNQNITVLSYGGDGGGPFDIRNVKTIVLETSNESLESITFTNTSGKSRKIGGGSGRPIRSHRIAIDPTEEYLTGISGTVELQDRKWVVKSIHFHTNQEEMYGPYGNECGTPFSFRQTGGEISGFHGKAGKLIDSIGVYVKPLSN